MAAHHVRVAAVEILEPRYLWRPKEPTPGTMKKRMEIARVDMKSRLMTLPEVSVYLRVSRVTVYRMLRRKDIPAFRIAGKWRFNIEDLGHWIEKESRPGGLRKP